MRPDSDRCVLRKNRQATVDRVTGEIPKPGTTRPISANADGLDSAASHLWGRTLSRITSYGGRATTHSALAAPWLATVSQVGGTTVTVMRNFSSPLSPGVAVSFIDSGGRGGDRVPATIASETPRLRPISRSRRETVTLTLSQAVPGVDGERSAMIDTDPAKLGSGRSSPTNTVQEGVFRAGSGWRACGMSTRTTTIIQRTSSDGIFIQQLNASSDNTDSRPFLRRHDSEQPGGQASVSVRQRIPRGRGCRRVHRHAFRRMRKTLR